MEHNNNSSWVRRSISISILLLVALGAITWLVKNRSIAPADNSNTKMRVVTSFYPLYFFAQQIGGDMVSVINLTPAGTEPHDYEPTPKDIAQIEKSKLLVLNGGGLEAWGDKVTKNIDQNNTRVVVAGKDIIEAAQAQEGTANIDPHIWLSLPLAIKMVEKIKMGIEQADPTNSSYYDARASVLEAKLADLHQEYQKGLASCVNTNIITSHAAFGYLGATYGLHPVSIAGLSPDTEPSPRQLGDIVQLARKNNTKYIFFESLVSPKLSETIAREVGAQTLVLNPLEGLTPDEIMGGSDYFTEMKINLKNLETACK